MSELFSLDQIANLGAELQDLFVDVELIHDVTADLTQNEADVQQTGFRPGRWCRRGWSR